MKGLSESSGIIFCFVAVFALDLLVASLPPDLLELLVRENGPIENASVVGYLLATCWLCIRAGQAPKNGKMAYFLPALLVLGLALRELDFHCRFTTMGIFKTLFYVSPKVPVPEKIIVTIIVSSMLIALFWYAKKSLPGLIQGLRQRENRAICVAIAVAFACISKTFDRCSDEIRDVCLYLFNVNPSSLLRVSEEVLELGIPLFILLAIYYAPKPKKSDGNPIPFV